MKKPLVSALVCCVLLCTGLLSSPASAASPAGQDHFTDDDYTFTKIQDIGSYAPLNDHFGRGGTVYFSDGLLLMRSSDMQYRYLGEDGKLRDLNRGRFDAVLPFSDGLAAVVSGNKVGYINPQGDLVIPCQFDALYGAFGAPCAPLFQNGTAWVFRYREGTDIDRVSIDGDAYGSWAKIDKTGKLLTDYSADVYLGRMGISNEFYQQYNLFCPEESAMGMVGFDEECTASSVGTFMARFGTSDTGLVRLPSGKTGADGQIETIPYVVQRKPVAQTRYQSTAKLTNACIAEMDYNDFTLTITNPTDSRDSGTVALVLASGMGTVHFVDYDLAAKESKEYHVAVSGHVGVGADRSMVVLSKGWGAYLNADIITFKSDEDRDTYRASVVYEKNMDHYVTQGSGNGASARVVICNGQPGDDWLKNYTGIGRHDKPYQSSTRSHDICK